MNEIVKFPVNTPVEVTLRSEAGERVQGRYGEQVRYSLFDDRIMYVPLYVEQRFRELAIGAGEPLLLCKQQVKNGDRNRTEWSIKRAPQQPTVWADETVEVEPVAAESIPALQAVEVERNGAQRPIEHQSAVNGIAKQEEQPSGNSTAPMAQESALQTNNQHQRMNTAQAHVTDIVLASAASTRRGELTSKDSVFLPAMTMDVAIARRSAIVEFTRRIMVKDQDFGEIPGTHKPTLLKPGAEKLCNFFGLEPEFTPIVEDVDWTGGEHGGEVFCYARYRCRLLREGRVVGAGEGSCNSWEAKYRYRWVAEEQVPEHLDRTQLLKREVRRTLCEFDFAIERAETTGAYGKPAEHWQRFREAIRAGTARSVEKSTRRGNAVAWEIDLDSVLYRIPNPDVADVINTIQKMAQKRALVAATLIATSASEFFTQDVEDADSSGRNNDTGTQPVVTREAQEYARDRKLDEVPSKPARREEADGAVKPWKNFGEMRQLFEQLREQVGETRYLEEMELAGVQNPGQFQSASKALVCYERLAQIAAQPEVA
jgi:hypothetical protein